MQQLLVTGNIQAFHISPPEFNKKTNQEIVELFIKGSDGRNIFLYEADREKLRNLVSDNSSNDGYCDLIKEAFTIFKSRLKQADSIVAVLDSKPFVYSAKDTITFIGSGNGKRPVPKNTADARNRIERRLKYECLDYIIKPLKEGEDVLKLSEAEMTVRQADAKKRSILRFKRYLENFNSDTKLKHHIGDCLSNAITNRCDPHSSYFNLYDKESWDSGLSTQEHSFGFYVDENEAGEIVISELVPGGPAWKSNELHEGDVLIAFQFEKEKLVELGSMAVEDYYSEFYKSGAKNVELTFRRKDNQVKKIRLQKAKIASQENVMNSYILSKGAIKFGYIPIPAFYSDDDEMDGRQGCANDVAKEIIKLKQDSIQGLILDLRYNGGGSMKEAMGLGGIFIDEGPLAVLKMRNAKPALLKDLNRGTIYDGPLIVLINGASASASEFLTATLQDYGRAIIVGSTTYGKGTAQGVYPADTNLYKARGKKYYLNPAFGYVKTTMGKFYRVTTISHQKKGIVPDIHIPDLLESTMEKEADEEYALPCDSVNKKVFFTKTDDLPLETLNEWSQKRIHANQKFNDIISLGDSLSKVKDRDLKVALNVKDFKKYAASQDRLAHHIEECMEMGEETELVVKNNVFSQKLIAIDEYSRKNNEELIERIKKDLILHETFLILNDLNTIRK
jgi:carboxyl-terminal processing protease